MIVVKLRNVNCLKEYIFANIPRGREIVGSIRKKRAAVPGRAFLNDPRGGYSLRAGKKAAGWLPAPGWAGPPPRGGGVGCALRKALFPG